MAKIILDSEKELEDFAAELMAAGVCPFFGYSYSTVRQQCRIGNYGVADIVAVAEGFDGPGGSPETFEKELVVIEVKKGAIGAETYSQLHRYMTGLRHAFGEKITIRGAILGTEWNPDDEFMTGFCVGEAFLAKFDLTEGLVIEESYGWQRNVPGRVDDSILSELCKEKDRALVAVK